MKRLFALVMVLLLLMAAFAVSEEDIPQASDSAVSETEPTAIADPDPVEGSEEQDMQTDAAEQASQEDGQPPREEATVPDNETDEDSRTAEPETDAPIEAAAEDGSNQAEEDLQTVDGEEAPFSAGYAHISDGTEVYREYADTVAAYRLGSGVVYALERKNTRLKIAFSDGENVLFAWAEEKDLAPMNEDGIAAYLDETGECETACGDHPLVGIAVARINVAMTVGASMTLGSGESLPIHVSFSDGESYPVTFRSSKTSVVTVNGDGLVTAKRVGKATVTVSSPFGSSKVAVTVRKAPARVYISNNSYTLGIGEKRNISASLPRNTAGGISFSCSDPDVVSLVDNGDRTASLEAVGTGRAVITARSFNGRTKTCTVTVLQAPSGVDIRLPDELGTGESARAGALLPEGSAGACSFTSDSPEIVSVDSASGVVTARKTGTATIQVQTYNGKTAKMTVKVMAAPTGVRLPCGNLTISLGDTYAMPAPVLLGENAGCGAFTWSVKSGKYVSVDANGILRAKRKGTTTVTVKTYNGKKASVRVRVVAAPKSMSVDVSELKLYMGKEYTPRIGLNNNASSQYRLTSSDTGCVEISEDGRTILATAPGSAEITIQSYNGLKKTISVWVPKLPTVVNLNSKKLTLGSGERYTLTAAVGEGEDTPFTYTSSNTAAAAVSEDGTVTAGESGDAVITVSTNNGLEDTCSVTVKKAPSSVTLEPACVRMGLAEGSVRLTAGLSSEAEAGGITYTVDKPSVATVDDGGLVTFHSAGKACVTARTYNGLTASTELEIGAVPIAMHAQVDRPVLGAGDSTSISVEFEGGFEAWSVRSSDESVIAVNNGELIAVEAGTATLVVTSCSGLTAVLCVEVIPAPDGIRLEEAELVLVRGRVESAALNASALLGGEDSKARLIFTSSDESVAEVDAFGMVHAVDYGKCVITVQTYNGYSAECAVAVEGILYGKKIGIDPGHQSKLDTSQEPVAPHSSETKAKVSSGTSGVSTKVPEYKVNLQVALKLKARLEEMGAEVVISRESNDVNISNVQRAKLMNSNNVDFWLRLHCDGSSDSKINGVRIFIRSTMRYNSSEVPNASEVLESEARLAAAMGKSICAATGAARGTVHKSDKYSGNNWSMVPCALVEMGFMTNPDEDKKLNTPEYQDRIVDGIVNATLAYYGLG